MWIFPPKGSMLDEVVAVRRAFGGSCACCGQHLRVALVTEWECWNEDSPRNTDRGAGNILQP
jgi:hypothetical protein